MKVLKFFLINLNIGFLFNLFPSIVFFSTSIEFKAVSLFLINLFFIVIFFKKNYINFHQINFSVTNKNDFEIIIKLFFILLIIQIGISFFYQHSGNLIFHIGLFLISFTFIKLIRFIRNIDGVSLLINCYSFLCVFILFSSIFVFLLSSTGLYDPYTNLVDYGVFEEFDRNFDITKENIYNPLHLTFIIESFRGIPFFGQFGLFTGLSHEPHTSMLFVIPGIFLFVRNKSKYIQVLFCILSVFYALIASSVTGIIVLFFSLFVYISHSKIKTVNFIKLIILFSLLLLIFLKLDSILSDLGLDIISTKVNSQSSYSSKGVSISLISYLYSPITIFGSGTFVNLQSYYAKDIGFINFIIILLIQLLFLRGLIKLFIKSYNQTEYLFYFLFGFYFFFHSLKLGNQVFGNLFFIFIIFILSTTNVSKKKNKALGYF